MFEPHATVSYVWGEGRDHRTTLANMQDRAEIGWPSLYHLHTPQGASPEYQSRERRMDQLEPQRSCHALDLWQPTLTICATVGASAKTGLLALDEKKNTNQKIAKCVKGVHLVLHQPPEISMESSAWNQRAWIFQGRLLSGRCLIFTGRQVNFQCRSTGMSGAIFADKLDQGWPLENPIDAISLTSTVISVEAF
ncbi:hypothetical protein TSTA_093460 [Talaromyces stipitatus ATCC 10500]|uniref:Heterokaryon incompatibility domain-containing protein n=1 Tax=Talaromyces stipitatus (strain ATCC 10500 / CBS 375.48 / QM 6759 / NRRL 1006) TaxID=441959 RepID=B8M1L3_TALSN|nr:uncharacterized protein TSTA_093460 [Talaromyces stipitatus ATCC 10500]EED22100.1 hypothetical protein TSTA_093460 [Talaromyces stipitatus ATCC 10500]